MSNSDDAATLRLNLGVDGQTLCLPDPGENAMVVMRYNGVELGYIIKLEHMGNDECVCTPLLMTRDVLKGLADVK